MEDDIEMVGAMQACVMLGVSPPTLYRKINSGELKSHKVKGRRRIEVPSIRACRSRMLDDMQRKVDAAKLEASAAG